MGSYTMTSGQSEASGLKNVHALLYGLCLVVTAVALMLVAGLVHVTLVAIGNTELIVRYIVPAYLILAALAWTGFALSLFDLFVLLPYKRRARLVHYALPKRMDLTIVLTAYNDELSIGQAVEDFQSHPLVKRIIVVENNSRDATADVARGAGADVVTETAPGYGRCVFRALTEASAFPDTDLTLLCEGDMTFRAYDIDKFIAYIPHADIVNGTRIVEQLRSRDTQLTTFMYYGNFFVGKLLEAKHIGKGTFTDVGTTYKLCRNDALRRLLPLLKPEVNLEFNAHFLDTALAHDFRLLECPVTFHNRVGLSKGGNTSNSRALKVGLRMLYGIIFGWVLTA